MLGIPLVSWSICSSLRSRYIDLTLVSSNCEHVREITYDIIYKLGMGETCEPKEFYSLIKSNRLDFIQRPDEYATATSKNEESLIHAYNYAKENLDIDADIVVNLQPTSPIRDTKDSVLLDDCLEKMEKEKADSLFTGTRHTPFYFKIIDGEVKAEWDIYNRPMRQELENSNSNWPWHWHDDGNVYLVSTPTLLSSQCRLGGKISMYELTHAQSLQIDSGEDFQIIEQIMRDFVKP